MSQPGASRITGTRRHRLDEGHRRCRDLTKAYGTTYYWGTAFLDAQQRRDTFSVYALCRLADDIVDEPDTPHDLNLGLPPGAGPGERLEAFVARFHAACARGDDPHPTLAAIVDTVQRLAIPADCFERFFASMRLDLTRTSWTSWEELRDVYMEGSAAVIGEMMLPVLRPASDAAREPARTLGLAFQLTNFIRDVGEDLDRGRVYLPAEDLERYGADPWLRQVTPQWRTFLRAQIARNRELYQAAEAGLELLPAKSARCVGAALTMYSAILTQIELADYDVFSARARVPASAKAAMAARVLVTGRARTTPAADTGTTSRMGPGAPHAGTPRIDTPAARIPLRRLPQPAPDQLRSTWRQAALPRITRALHAASGRDPGGWYVVGASSDLGATTSLVRTVAGQEIALWRDPQGGLLAGPGACPHMGARLDACPTSGGDVLCRWHGLRLPSQWPGQWPLLPAYDDGVLLWVQLATAGETPTTQPRLATRPPLDQALVAVYSQAARCEPQDIIANRLDPWHGAWLHPYAFSHLEVDESASTVDLLVTDVTFRLGRTWGVPVRAEFACPDARTIVMTIVAGEGAGSVVETHATPLGTGVDGRPWTVMTEATVATSPRWGFRLARAAAPLVRASMLRTQARLWVDDLAYAERRHHVRQGQQARRAQRAEQAPRDQPAFTRASQRRPGGADVE